MARAQISFEYMIVMGFITFILVGVMATAFFYGSSIQDKIRITQITNYGNKIVSSADSVFYAGEPSKSTISVYLPESVKEINVYDNSIYISFQTSTGLNKLSFVSEVPLIYNAPQITSGLKNLELKIVSGGVIITQV